MAAQWLRSKLYGVPATQRQHCFTVNDRPSDRNDLDEELLGAAVQWRARQYEIDAQMADFEEHAFLDLLDFGSEELFKRHYEYRWVVGSAIISLDLHADGKTFFLALQARILQEAKAQLLV
jgi:hypothetical protein